MRHTSCEIHRLGHTNVLFLMTYLQRQMKVPTLSLPFLLLDVIVDKINMRQLTALLEYLAVQLEYNLRVDPVINF